MKSVLIVVAIGALVLGSILTIGLLMEQNKPQPNIIFYEAPVSVPTQAQYERAVSTPVPSSATAYAVIKVNPPMEGP